MTKQKTALRFAREIMNQSQAYYDEEINAIILVDEKMNENFFLFHSLNQVIQVIESWLPDNLQLMMHLMRQEFSVSIQDKDYNSIAEVSNIDKCLALMLAALEANERLKEAE